MSAEVCHNVWQWHAKKACWRFMGSFIIRRAVVSWITMQYCHWELQNKNVEIVNCKPYCYFVVATIIIFFTVCFKGCCWCWCYYCCCYCFAVNEIGSQCPGFPNSFNINEMKIISLSVQLLSNKNNQVSS